SESTPDSNAVDDNKVVDQEVTFEPLSLNALGGGSVNATGASETNAEASIRSIMQHLKPLQVMLGGWRGTTRREYEGFKAVDNHEWIWDLRTNPSQPALIIESDKSPYLRKGRITWDESRGQFALQATDGEGITRDFYGRFTEPVQEVVGSDDKLHRVFRLQFDQDAETDVDGSQPNDFWQIAFAQQDNNRYLLEVAHRRAKTDFRRYDTVSTQREGTSFAINDSDYGEKTCIISEGLGTIQVSYKGRDYWVCCTGCKAAFDEDPEKWIARAAERDKEKKKQ
ncbi:MAG: hypothetical protein KDA91_22230, partial [Planctomycetaceae bacterium]|nr:hypothetical protein [Planctomycetaceae bacterium]